MKYESFILNGLKVMAKVKVFVYAANADADADADGRAMTLAPRLAKKCQNASKCLLRNGTESKNTSSHILLDNFNAFGLSRNNFFCCKQRGRGGGRF